MTATPASMKVPPKRKGNGSTFKFKAKSTTGLNESPSEKEGKSFFFWRLARALEASMKVPPKRKGNFLLLNWFFAFIQPQ